MGHILYRMMEDISAGAYIVWVYINPYDGRVWYYD